MSKIVNFFNINRYPTERRNQFIFNILLGVVLMLFFVAMKDTTMRQSFINGWFDRYIKLRMDSETDTWKAAQDIIFLDFDDKSFQTLAKPDLTPRDKVAQLLNVAYQGGAKVVVLDMDFSEDDYSPAKKFDGEEFAKSGSERDKDLFDLLEQIKNDSAAQTKILLPLATYADRTIKHNSFAALIDNEKIFAVTPTFTVNQVGDNYARFWLPYLEVKDAQTGEQKILWSIPLLTAVLYSGNFAELENLQAEIFNTDKNFFVTTIKEPFKFYRERTRDGDLLRDTISLQYNRIQYVAIPPDVLAQIPFGTISPINIGHWRRDGLDNKKIDCRDKIVIIGRADEDCADFFSTPVGNLPGMYVHGNSIASILGETRPHLTSPYKHILIEIILIVIASYAFLILSEFRAKCLIFALTPLCWLFTYIYFCATNEFIYLSFAFTAVGVYNFINNIQAFIVGGISFRHFFRRR